jgi:5-methylcytosine-specific restriction endonuclease McrA
MLAKIGSPYLLLVGGCTLGDVLVLNATYEPLNVVSIKRAVVLLLKEKAELVEAAEAQLRSENLSLSVPLVIRLVYFVKIPRRVSLPVTRRTVLSRDNYTCQYCGSTPPRKDLTVDHVLPRSRGGKTTWENVATACERCNGRKGNRTPTEASMKLLNKPKRPRYIAIATVASAEARQAWGKYIWE